MVQYGKNKKYLTDRKGSINKFAAHQVVIKDNERAFCVFERRTRGEQNEIFI